MSRFATLKLAALLGISALVIVIDQWTKHWIHSRFQWGESLSVVANFFSITYVRNKGAAFGFCNSCPPGFREPFFLIVPVLILFVILAFYVFLKPERRGLIVPVCLIISGAIGNLIDRTRYGYVVDFLDFYWKDWHYPAFNVADSAIVVGVCVWGVLEYARPSATKGTKGTAQVS